MKNNNEITVKVTCDPEELYKILEEKGFKVIDKFTLDDVYMIPKTIDLKNETACDILSKVILIRDITGHISGKRTKKITFKNKKIDDIGNIISQNSINCEVQNIEDAKSIFEAIGYYQLMQIIEDNRVYEKDGFSIAIKDIKDGANLIEIETNEKYDTIDKLKEKLKELDLPVDYSDFFVKKAEIELDKIKKN